MKKHTDKEREKKLLDALSATIVIGELHAFYNEELRHTKFYRHDLKSTQKKMTKILQNHERNEFDKIYDLEPERMHSMSNRVLDMIDSIGKGIFCNTMENAQLIIANHIDPKSIGGIVKKVLGKHQREIKRRKLNSSEQPTL